MFSFPDKIMIKITDAQTMEPIGKIAVELKIFANRKSDYYMIPEISDTEGSIVISKDWMESQINEQRNMFIMDFSSTLEDCKPKIGIEVLSGGSIKILNRSRKEEWHLEPILEDTDNYLYEGLYVEQDLIENQITASVTLRISKK